MCSAALGGTYLAQAVDYQRPAITRPIHSSRSFVATSSTVVLPVATAAALLPELPSTPHFILQWPNMSLLHGPHLQSKKSLNLEHNNSNIPIPAGLSQPKLVPPARLLRAQPWLHTLCCSSTQPSTSLHGPWNSPQNPKVTQNAATQTGQRRRMAPPLLSRSDLPQTAAAGASGHQGLPLLQEVCAVCSTTTDTNHCAGARIAKRLDESTLSGSTRALMLTSLAHFSGVSW